jgi:hypothetical protein
MTPDVAFLARIIDGAGGGVAEMRLTKRVKHSRRSNAIRMLLAISVPLG